MKKSLVIISFAFIFLLSMSVVSAGFFDWLTGDAGSRLTVSERPTAVDNCGSGCASHQTCTYTEGTDSYDCTQGISVKGDLRPTAVDNCGSGCASHQTCTYTEGTDSYDCTQSIKKIRDTSSQNSRFGAAGDCPRGWNVISAKEGGNCCVKGKSSGSSSLGSLFRRR